MSPRFAAVLASFWLAVLTAVPATTVAQSCHTPALDAGEAGTGAVVRPVQLRAALSASAATFATASYTGEYQGIFPSLTADARYVRASVALPAYRIVRNGMRDAGVGDLAIDLRAPIVRGDSAGVTAGFEFALTAPTGSVRKQLGMGHTMLMPGVYTTYERRGLLLVLQVAYGRAIGGSTMHAHHGPQPMVNPMNRSELEHALGVSYALRDWLRFTGRLYGATPLFNEAGRAREVVGFGALTQLLMFDLSLELHLPVVGDPFEHKTLLALGARF